MYAIVFDHSLNFLFRNSEIEPKKTQKHIQTQLSKLITILDSEKIEEIEFIIKFSSFIFETVLKNAEKFSKNSGIIGNTLKLLSHKTIFDHNKDSIV